LRFILVCIQLFVLILVELFELGVCKGFSFVDFDKVDKIRSP